MNIYKKAAGRYLFFLMISVCCFFFTTCGLETFYYLDPPRPTGHDTKFDSSDPLSFYFSFLTTETGNNGSLPGDFNFEGTQVYYKIYNNYTKMEQNEASVDNINTSSTSSASAAADRIIKTYGYQTLNLADNYDEPLLDLKGRAKTDDPLVPQNGSNRYVYIRLNDYGSDEAYKNIIFISDRAMSSYINGESTDDEKDGIKTLLGYPRRSVDQKPGFNFNSDDDDNPLPQQGDLDFDYSSSPSEEGKWYVDMYAVSKGMDTNFVDSFSRVLFLGSITITESDYDD